MTTKNIHRLFDFILLLKGIHAAIELVGGCIFYIVGADSTAAFYFVGHGIVNGFVALSLWKEKLWAYPVSFVVIGVFIVYQVYLLTFGYSWWLAILTILDVALLFLAWQEYKILKGKAPQ